MLLVRCADDLVTGRRLKMATAAKMRSDRGRMHEQMRKKRRGRRGEEEERKREGGEELMVVGLDRLEKSSGVKETHRGGKKMVHEEEGKVSFFCLFFFLSKNILS